MGFEAGKPRPANAGRKKGSVNKKSLLVREILENHGINLVEQILVRLPQIDKDEQVRALIQMLPYAYPKLTAIEHSGEVGNPYLEKPLEELEKLVREKIKKK